MVNPHVSVILNGTNVSPIQGSTQPLRISRKNTRSPSAPPPSASRSVPASASTSAPPAPIPSTSPPPRVTQTTSAPSSAAPTSTPSRTYAQATPTSTPSKSSSQSAPSASTPSTSASTMTPSTSVRKLRRRPTNPPVVPVRSAARSFSGSLPSGTSASGTTASGTTAVEAGATAPSEPPARATTPKALPPSAANASETTVSAPTPGVPPPSGTATAAMTPSAATTTKPTVGVAAASGAASGKANPTTPARLAIPSAPTTPATPATPTPSKVPVSGLPRTRKSSIPRFGSTVSPKVPPVPGSPLRRARLIGGADTGPPTPSARMPPVRPTISSQTPPPLPPSQLPSEAQPPSSGPVPEGAKTRVSPVKTPPKTPPVSCTTELSDGRANGRTSVNGDRNENGIENGIENGHHKHLASDKTVSSWEEEAQSAMRKAHDLEIQYRLLQAEHSRCNPRLERPMRALRREGHDGMEEQLTALLLNRELLSTVVRSLPRDQRMGLMGIIAEACRPSDIQAQIEMLQRFKEMRTGVLERMDDNQCIEVLRLLGRQDLLQMRLVSKRFDRLATSPKVWKPMCRELEARWDGTIALSNYNLDDDGDWLGLYQSLWQREKHWTNGHAQSLAVLGGHTNYVTSLKLCGETLISASYDDTIRIWHLPYVITKASSVPPPTVIPAKSVSSLDFYAPEGVLVTGSHEVGRASVWRQIDGEWKVERILSGHLHGTRAVAINAQWLVSVGSDKAIVVWDWRNGTKVVRFGQQTNVCVGMTLLDNFIITATVDGIIRTFSIIKREMLGQFKLSDMATRYPEYADKLKEVGAGALGMLTWFTAEGRFLACATKDIVIRLAWDWATLEEQADLTEGIESPTKTTFPESQGPPLTPVVARARPTGAGHSSRSSLGGHSSRPSSPRTTSAAQHKAPLFPSAATPSSVGGATCKILPGYLEDQLPSPTTMKTTAQFALARWPMIVEVLDITGTERGAFEAGRVRIVTSRRLSARAGAERRVLVGTENVSPDGKANMMLVPLGGVWDTKGKAAGLQAASKNPMSLALDHDKLVYGCADGSLVVAGFITTQKSAQTTPTASPSIRKPRASRTS